MCITYIYLCYTRDEPPWSHNSRVLLWFWFPLRAIPGAFRLYVRLPPAMPMALLADGGWRALPLVRATAVGWAWAVCWSGLVVSDQDVQGYSTQVLEDSKGQSVQLFEAISVSSYFTSRMAEFGTDSGDWCDSWKMDWISWRVSTRKLCMGIGIWYSSKSMPEKWKLHETVENDRGLARETKHCWQYRHPAKQQETWKLVDLLSRGSMREGQLSTWFATIPNAQILLHSKIAFVFCTGFVSVNVVSFLIGGDAVPTEFRWYVHTLTTDWMSWEATATYWAAFEILVNQNTHGRVQTLTLAEHLKKWVEESVLELLMFLT